VKIKITEYYDGAEFTEQTGQQPPVDNTMASNSSGFYGQPSVSPQQQVNGWGIPNMAPRMGMPQQGAAPKKFYTIQRVNGNGGNGKGDGVAGPHKHTLEESDRVKKNSVLRWMMKNDKDKKKAQVSLIFSVVHTLITFNIPTSHYSGCIRVHAWTLKQPGRSIGASRITSLFDIRESISGICCPICITSAFYNFRRLLYTSGVDIAISSQSGLLGQLQRKLVSFSACGSSSLTHFNTSLPFSVQFSSFPLYNMTDPNQGGDPTKKTYHKKATGNALTTVKNRSKDDELKLYGSCFW
jgi:hypothetical protein